MYSGGGLGWGFFGIFAEHAIAQGCAVGGQKATPQNLPLRVKMGKLRTRIRSTRWQGIDLKCRYLWIMVADTFNVLITTATSWNGSTMRFLSFIAALILSVYRPVLADGFDFDKFDQMDQASKFAVLDAGLKTHEAALSNIEFTTKDHEEFWYRKQHKFIPDDDITQTTKMGFDSIFVHIDRKNIANGILEEQWIAGDKNEWRSFGIRKSANGQVKQYGQVNRGYPSFISNPYTEMLDGITQGGPILHGDWKTAWKIESMSCCPMSEYLEAVWNGDGNGKMYECTVTTHNDEHQHKLIQMQVKSLHPGGHWGTTDYMVDPNLGFMPYWYHYKEDIIATKDLFRIKRTTISVDSVQKVGDAWVPSHVSENGFQSLSSAPFLAADVRVFKLVDCKIGSVTRADVADTAVQFPPGVDVVDETKPLPTN
jgi:hypothetical protein